jgi:hypothetical protein
VIGNDKDNNTISMGHVIRGNTVINKIDPPEVAPLGIRTHSRCANMVLLCYSASLCRDTLYLFELYAVYNMLIGCTYTCPPACLMLGSRGWVQPTRTGTAVTTC